MFIVESGELDKPLLLVELKDINKPTTAFDIKQSDNTSVCIDLPPPPPPPKILKKLFGILFKIYCDYV